MSLFSDVAPGTPQSSGRSNSPRRAGAGFNSIFVRLPLTVVKLMGKGFVLFIAVLVGSKSKTRKTYYKSGPSWRKWPW